MAKMALFHLLVSAAKLISRKIRMAENVAQFPHCRKEFCTVWKFQNLSATLILREIKLPNEKKWWHFLISRKNAEKLLNFHTVQNSFLNQLILFFKAAIMEAHTIGILTKTRALMSTISEEGQNRFVCQMMVEGLYPPHMGVYPQTPLLTYHHMLLGLNNIRPLRPPPTSIDLLWLWWV